MKIQQRIYEDKWITKSSNISSNENCNLVFVFGARNLIENNDLINGIVTDYPKASIVFSSTAGEILDLQVFDNTLILTAIEFETTKIESKLININDYNNSFNSGVELVSKFNQNDLKHIFILSDGQKVNGTKLLQGINSTIPEHVSVTGGLAGDAANFQKTLVGLNKDIKEGNIVAIALYGNSLKVGYGSFGGWDAFGPERLITKSEDNILYEFDYKPALSLYKTYLGEKAAGLPATALLFPITIKADEHSQPIVRTILSIDENKGSLTFAGNVPEGTYARLMKANFERLIDGASQAAERASQTIKEPQLSILISCVGRKLVLGQRIDEEIEIVREVIGTSSLITGFYSYGEICPFVANLKSELHNQTMTITTFSEL